MRTRSFRLGARIVMALTVSSAVLSVALLAGGVPPITVTVSGGGFEPATVTARVHTLPHEDNREVCVTIADADGEVTRDCRPVLGARGPNSQEMRFVDLGGGEYEARASLCRVYWDAATDTCAQWVYARPARFIIGGWFGNKSYKRKRGE